MVFLYGSDNGKRGTTYRSPPASLTTRETTRSSSELEPSGIVNKDAAGGAAALPGVVAAETLKPVIGVPITSALSGFDSLLSIAQMPGGIPVATVAIGKAGARNSALLAAEILAVSQPALKKRLQDYRLTQREKVIRDAKKLENHA